MKKSQWLIRSVSIFLASTLVTSALGSSFFDRSRYEPGPYRLANCNGVHYFCTNQTPSGDQNFWQLAPDNFNYTDPKKSGAIYGCTGSTYMQGSSPQQTADSIGNCRYSS